MKAEFETFLPLISVVKQWSDRKKKGKFKLISSYVFVNLSVQNLKNILNRIGVVLILK
jgi:hypothetical protein